VFVATRGARGAPKQFDAGRGRRSAAAGRTFLFRPRGDSEEARGPRGRGACANAERPGIL